MSKASSSSRHFSQGAHRHRGLVWDPRHTEKRMRILTLSGLFCVEMRWMALSPKSSFTLNGSSSFAHFHKHIFNHEGPRGQIHTYIVARPQEEWVIWSSRRLDHHQGPSLPPPLPVLIPHIQSSPPFSPLLHPKTHTLFFVLSLSRGLSLTRRLPF